MVAVRFDTGAVRPKTRLARETAEGLVDCDGRFLSGMMVDIRGADESETKTFTACECESVSLLSTPERQPSPMLTSMRAGVRNLLLRDAPRRSSTLTGVAPPAEDTPVPTPGRYRHKNLASDVVSLPKGEP